MIRLVLVKLEKIKYLMIHLQLNNNLIKHYRNLNKVHHKYIKNMYFNLIKWINWINKKNQKSMCHLHFHKVKNDNMNFISIIQSYVNESAYLIYGLFATNSVSLLGK